LSKISGSNRLYFPTVGLHRKHP